MPTAAKLCAALAFAALGWVAAAVLAQGLPEGLRVGWLREVAAATGVLCGWRIMGANVGRGMAAAAGTGLSTGAAMLVLVLVWAAFAGMFGAASWRTYDEPVAALNGALSGVMQQVLRFGALLADGRFAVVMLAGSVSGGLLAERVGRRWS